MTFWATIRNSSRRRAKCRVLQEKWVEIPPRGWEKKRCQVKFDHNTVVLCQSGQHRPCPRTVWLHYQVTAICMTPAKSSPKKLRQLSSETMILRIVIAELQIPSVVGLSDFFPVAEAEFIWYK